MNIVEANFIGIFKIGDNINHNLKILERLYHYYEMENSENKKLLLKPIIILNVSIIEAVLYDLHFRINEHTTEGVKNIPIDVLEDIRSKKIDVLEKLIASSKKRNLLFCDEGENLYEELDELRKIRNRVHIQNSKSHFESDEIKAYNKNRKILSEICLEKVLKTMSEKFYRPDYAICVEEFSLPWNKHI